jgi:hypothetical protein
MYRLHLKGEPPESGSQHDTREAAFEVQKANGQQASHKITFHPSADDLEDWQYRERQKYRTGVYVRTPWHFEEAEYAQTQWDEVGCVERIVYPRFCHLSLDQKGMVAYTPSPEHGLQNRQVRTRPGKYLEQFLTGPDQRRQWPEWIAKVGAFSGALQIARTADDIESVYVHSHGSYTSCMSGTRQQRRGDYTWGRCSQHPVRAYGDSDLGVAYLGTLGERITARCVVWPDKKIYTRLYGDIVLTELLKAHGYESGTAHGARLRAIPEGDGWLVPYIDHVECCRPVRGDGSGSTIQWLKLGEGDLDCQNTNGCTGNPPDEEDATYSCADCGAWVTDDHFHSDYDICDECYANTYADCHQCGGTQRQDELVELTIIGRFGGSRVRFFCHDHTVPCVLCDEAFMPDYVALDAEAVRESRRRRDTYAHVCRTCDDGTMHYCATCERTYQPGDRTDCSACDTPVNQQEANDDAVATTEVVTEESLIFPHLNI